MKQNKNIVIVNQDAGYLMIDLANAYHQAGYRVSLIAGRLVKRDTELFDGVGFYKIIRYNKATTFRRLYTWVLATLQIWYLINTKFRNHKILFVTNPPLAPLLSLFVPNQTSVLIYDVFPDALVDAGFLSSKSVLNSLWKTMNSKAFSKADTVFTISEGMKSVLTQYVSDSKIKVVPIWVDNEFLRPVQVEENIFIRNNGLAGKFIVLYSGNLGKTGDVECMIELAKQTIDEDIQYVIIGEGVKRASIEKSIVENRLSNCTLLPWQSAEMLPYSLSAASLAVVSLGKNTSKIAMPSKLYGYLAVGAPVLSLADCDSELARIVNKYNFGQNFEPKSIDEIVKFIVSLKSDKRLSVKFSTNALNTSKNFTKENVQYFVNN